MAGGPEDHFTDGRWNWWGPTGPPHPPRPRVARAGATTPLRSRHRVHLRSAEKGTLPLCASGSRNRHGYRVCGWVGSLPRPSEGLARPLPWPLSRMNTGFAPLGRHSAFCPRKIARSPDERALVPPQRGPRVSRTGLEPPAGMSGESGMRAAPRALTAGVRPAWSQLLAFGTRGRPELDPLTAVVVPASRGRRSARPRPSVPFRASQVR